MATSRDKVELLIEILGQEGVDKLTKSTENYRALLEDLARKMKAGDISAEEFTRSQAKLGRELEREQALLDQLIGKPGSGGAAGGGGGGGGGHGLLGASYAAQDFISVLSGGGGLGRALGAISNNIPQLLTGLGVGAGLTGVFSGLFTLVSAGVPIIQKWWEAAGDAEGAEKAKRQIEELTARIKHAHEEFEKLKNAPTDYEKESADLLRQYLQEQPNAEKLRGGLIATMGDKSGRAGMTPEQREEFDRAGTALLSDEAIDRLGDVAAMNASRAGQQAGPARQEAIDRARRARQEAEDRRAALVDAGKRARADLLIEDSLQAGSAGSAARGEITKRATDEPGKFAPNTARNLAEMSPAALEQFDKEWHDEQEEHKEWHDAQAAKRKKISEELDDNLEKLEDSNREWQQTKREATSRRKETERERARADKANLARANDTGIDERAEMAAAQLRAAGGYEDRFGRFRPLGPNQQTAMVQGLVGQQLQQRFPGMPEAERNRTARGIAEQANTRLQDRLDAARVEALDAGLGSVEATQAAMERTLGELQRVTARARMLEMNGRRLQRGVEQSPMPSGMSR